MTWINTLSGQHFSFTDTDPATIGIGIGIGIEDIAAALSNLCRFTGHFEQFYSVAQHSVHVSLQVPPPHRAGGPAARCSGGLQRRCQLTAESAAAGLPGG